MSGQPSHALGHGILTPPTTGSGSSHCRARARRMEASSSSTSAFGQFDISNVKFRVITPPRPRPLLSYTDGDLYKLILNIFGNEFETKAVQIASEVGIPTSSVEAEFVIRVFRNDPSDSQPTIYIVVDDWTPQSSSTWQKTVGGNVLPTKLEWDSKYLVDTHPAPSAYAGNLGRQSRSMHDLKLDSRVFKHGSSTKWTAARISKFKPDCAITEEKYIPGRTDDQRKSTEYMCTGYLTLDGAATFGNRGDSGAVVWDEYGKALGLLFTGQRPHQTKTGYSLVTPIEDVFESIKKMSGGEITHVRIAGT